MSRPATTSIFFPKVNANGVISFESPFYQFNPEAFPFDSVPLITPFWDDVNILRYGRIYYRQTDDVPSLGMAHDFIAKGFPAEAETFFPTVLFIATWDRVAEYGVSRFVVSCSIVQLLKVLFKVQGVITVA